MSPGSTLTTTLWGLFCACSWTWCIGMFLPKLFIERYGLPGFVMFAIPNVLGCAGFGYVLASRARARALVDEHGVAMVTFSLVAVAFHMFFIAFVVGEFALAPGAPAWLPLLASVAVYIVGRLLADLDDRAWLAAAALVYAASITAFAAIGLGAWPTLREAGAQPAGDLLWIGPVIVVGFLACPFLDLTFHRALQASPSRHAFAVFGVGFTVMIVFTAFLWFAPGPRLAAIALGHIVAQSIFTVGAHLREARCSPALACPRRRALYALLPLCAAPLLFVARLFSPGADLGSDLYLRFLAFYGLVFPAYVLLRIGPWRPLPPTRTSRLGLAAVIVVLAPFYEAGFIHDAPKALLVPAAALLAWAIARRR